jgi:hypothetical protein
MRSLESIVARDLTSADCGDVVSRFPPATTDGFAIEAERSLASWRLLPYRAFPRTSNLGFAWLQSRGQQKVHTAKGVESVIDQARGNVQAPRMMSI